AFNYCDPSKVDPKDCRIPNTYISSLLREESTETMQNRRKSRYFRRNITLIYLSLLKPSIPKDTQPSKFPRTKKFFFPLSGIITLYQTFGLVQNFVVGGWVGVLTRDLWLSICGLKNLEVVRRKVTSPKELAFRHLAALSIKSKVATTGFCQLFLVPISPFHTPIRVV
ncbi:hypothetical protein SK128_023390, partial [Halocaridina rubra]